MQNLFRVINSKLKNDILIVETGFGIDIHYKILHTTSVDAITKYKEDNLPDFVTNVSLKYLKIEKHKNVKTRKQVAEILKNQSIIPPNLEYDHVLFGFVYDNGDPNNNRWWLDLRDNKNQNVYNYYADKIEINCPITTKSWHDEDPNGIWHGRMVLSSNVIESVLEIKSGKLTINGKLRKECKPLNKKNVCSIQSIPEKTESLRLRYNIREDIWFCDILDKEDKEIGVIPCKSIICDAKMYTQIFMVGDNAKVSTRININNVSEVGIAINSLIIRGK